MISKKPLNVAIARDKSLSGSLNGWYKTAAAADWKNLMEVRQTFPTADFVYPFTVFNIKGNAYRLVTKIEYRFGQVFVKGVYTHAEYDKGQWKS